MIFSFSELFCGHYFCLNLSPFLISVVVRAQSCILCFFKKNQNMSFWDNHNVIFILSLWIYMPATYEVPSMSFMSKFWPTKCLVACSKLKSLQASKMSFAYRTKKNKFSPIDLEVYTLINNVLCETIWSNNILKH